MFTQWDIHESYLCHSTSCSGHRAEILIHACGSHQMHTSIQWLLLYIYSTSSILTGNSQLLLSSLLMAVLLTGNVQCSQHGDSLDIVIILVLYCNLT